MYDTRLVRHCAPTLVGAKTGSLFSCPFSTDLQMQTCLRRWNRLLSDTGLHVLPLCRQKHGSLIYIYQHSALLHDLSCPQAASLLRQHDYPLPSPERCVVHLMSALKQNSAFPHEIGLFLGYPPEDVLGFICDPLTCSYSGCWKVYGNVPAARRRFAAYHRCTQICCSLLARGFSLRQLTALPRDSFDFMM